MQNLTYGQTVKIKGKSGGDFLARVIYWNDMLNITIVITQDYKAIPARMDYIYLSDSSVDTDIPNQEMFSPLWRNANKYIRNSPYRICRSREKMLTSNLAVAWAHGILQTWIDEIGVAK
jgi:hypothetical protein